MKPVTNTRRHHHGTVTTWLMRRVVGGCEHSIAVTYTNHEPRREVARRIWRARRQLQIAVEQQRDAIRIQQQLSHHHY